MTIRRAFTDLMPADARVDDPVDITTSFVSTAINTDFVEISTKEASQLVLFVTHKAATAGIFSIEGTLDANAILTNVTAPTGWAPLPGKALHATGALAGVTSMPASNATHLMVFDVSTVQRVRIRMSTAFTSNLLPSKIIYQLRYRNETLV